MNKLILLILTTFSLSTYAFLSGPSQADLSNVTGTLAPANGGTSSSSDIINCSVTAASSSNTLVISIKNASGSDPSSSSPCKIGFRNATAATGTYSVVSVTAATSFTISDGSSLGCTASAQCVLYFYAINNGGTVVGAAINGAPLDEGSVQSSTAEGGAGAADSRQTLYSSAAQASKAVRLMARLTVTPGGSFVWDAAPTEISNAPFAKKVWFVNAAFTGGSPSLGTSAVTAYTEMTDAGLTLTPLPGSAPVGTMCSATNAATAPSLSATTCAAGNESIGMNFAIPEPGLYEVCASATISSGLDSGESVGPTFQWIETPTNAQTLTLESGSIVQLNIESAAADQDTGPGISFCGWFDWSHKAAGTVVGVRLMYEMSIGGAPDYVVLVADADANNGQRNLNVRARKL